MAVSFAVVVRWTLAEGADPAELRAAWSEPTHAIRSERGGLGSCLHRAPDGEFVAYARWPDRATWEASGRLPSPAPEASRRMAACIASRRDPLPLEIDTDLLPR